MSVLLSPEVIILFIEDVLLLGFNSLAVFLAFNIQKDFDLNQTTALQYRLERLTYLVSTIIRFSLIIKIFSFVFFIFTLDKLSNIIPGAMCGAGVTNASPYGSYVLLVKLFSLYLFGVWLMIDREDQKTEDYRYTVKKFRYFIIIYLFFLIELSLQYLYLSDIDPEKIVSCCGTVFNAASTSFAGQLLNIPNGIVLPSFYTIFALLMWTSLRQDVIWTGILNLFFLAFGLLTLISFFSTYIYELPSHQCPFCLLQGDYHYVGYLIYALLLSGSFFGIAALALNLFLGIHLKILKLSILLNTAFVVLVSAYPLFYYIRNGVWL
ncbi:MAG: hypothetical protein U9Q77_09220 [Candidatus Marinimicrobia bacterium]|nr:hypothetical protein [Candidatus Neomarinimicrobiota bacterium]